MERLISVTCYLLPFKGRSENLKSWQLFDPYPHLPIAIVFSLI